MGNPSSQGLPTWRQRLRGALAREGRTPTARWLQLATVAQDNTPRIRTLVFRNWVGHQDMNLFTDGRSGKIADLNHQPQVELCWLFRKASHQYRLRGVIKQQCPGVDDKAIAMAWQSLNDRSRALWSWPSPGEPFRPEAGFPKERPAQTPVPDHFVVLRLAIERVELLDLSRHPHQRPVWLRNDSWQEQRLNP